MDRIWAVTRYTLAQCLRTKVAAAFVILLAAALVAIPFTAVGDGTLAGRIRTFLAYGSAATGVLLGLATVFLSVALVAGDVSARHIFLTATKPIARWQYIVGRWLGVVLLDAILLVVAGGVMYGTAQHLRRLTPTALTEPEGIRRDRVAVENEIFAARAKVAPVPRPDMEARRLRKEIERLGEADYRKAIVTYMATYELTEEQARERVHEDIRERLQQTVSPGGAMQWYFRGVRAAGRLFTATARTLETRRVFLVTIRLRPDVVRRMTDTSEVRIAGRARQIGFAGPEEITVQVVEGTDDDLEAARQADSLEVTVRPRDKEPFQDVGRVTQREEQLIAWLEAPKALTERLTTRAFVEIGGLDGRVEGMDEKTLRVRFFDREAEGARRLLSRPGQDVAVVVHPALQLAYKISSSDVGTGKAVRGIWDAWGMNQDAPPYRELRDDPVEIVTRWNIPGRVVSDGGELQVTYVNRSPFVLSILSKDVRLFYRVGGFTLNFVRAMLLMFIQLVFLAALGVFAGSFLSFPVGCMLCLTLLPFSMGRAFLDEALGYVAIDGGGVITGMGRATLALMGALLPDFARTSPGPALVDALYISWTFLAREAATNIVLRAGVAILLACLIFHKRELARVQV